MRTHLTGGESLQAHLANSVNSIVALVMPRPTRLNEPEAPVTRAMVWTGEQTMRASARVISIS